MALNDRHQRGRRAGAPRGCCDPFRFGDALKEMISRALEETKFILGGEDAHAEDRPRSNADLFKIIGRLFIERVRFIACALRLSSEERAERWRAPIAFALFGLYRAREDRGVAPPPSERATVNGPHHDHIRAPIFGARRLIKDLNWMPAAALGARWIDVDEIGRGALFE